MMRPDGKVIGAFVVSAYKFPTEPDVGVSHPALWIGMSEW